mmetsp:Transcript_108564/g.346540  ORF Transcript_108564/g.346540 Transcript_108564/m.346540 type:complete len:286 (+) Transcript_108564:267-1124(+)
MGSGTLSAMTLPPASLLTSETSLSCSQSLLRSPFVSVRWSSPPSTDQSMSLPLIWWNNVPLKIVTPRTTTLKWRPSLADLTCTSLPEMDGGKCHQAYTSPAACSNRAGSPRRTLRILWSSTIASSTCAFASDAASRFRAFSCVRRSGGGRADAALGAKPENRESISSASSFDTCTRSRAARPSPAPPSALAGLPRAAAAPAPSAIAGCLDAVARCCWAAEAGKILSKGSSFPAAAPLSATSLHSSLARSYFSCSTCACLAFFTFSSRISWKKPSINWICSGGRLM